MASDGLQRKYYLISPLYPFSLVPLTVVVSEPRDHHRFFFFLVGASHAGRRSQRTFINTSSAIMFHLQSLIRADYRKSLFTSRSALVENTNASLNASDLPSSLSSWSSKASPTVALSNACARPHCEPSTNIIPFPTNSHPDPSISSALPLDYESLSRPKRALPLDAPRQRCQTPPSHSSLAPRRKALPLPGVIRQQSTSQSSATGVVHSHKLFECCRCVTAELMFTAAVHRSIVCRMKRARELNGSSEQNTDVEMKSMGAKDDGSLILNAQEELLVARLWQWLVDQGCSPVLLDDRTVDVPDRPRTSNSVGIVEDLSMDITPSHRMESLPPTGIPALIHSPAVLSQPPTILPPPPPEVSVAISSPFSTVSLPQPVPRRHAPIPSSARSIPVAPDALTVYTMPQLVATLMIRHRDRKAVKARAALPQTKKLIRTRSALATGRVVVAEDML